MIDFKTCRDASSRAETLVTEYGQRLFDTAMKFCGNRQDGEDIVFRTIERAVDRFDSFDGRSGLFSWLYAIMINFIRSDCRRKGANALTFVPEPPDSPDLSPSPDEALVAEENAELVRTAVDGLSFPLKTVLLMRYFDDFKVPEIAEILGIPEGTVKSRLNLAKLTVRKKLSNHFPDRDV